MADRDLSGHTFGEFLLVEKIGQGGFATVYRAEQPSLNRHVVVKVLRKTDDNSEQRFLREAQVASRFEHPFAAHVYAFGVTKDIDGERALWIAMELVQGITLRDWLAQHQTMPLETFVPFFESIAEVVHATHACGIVHRDLTPANLMVIEGGNRLFPKVIDFGIAKADVEQRWPEDAAPGPDAVATAPGGTTGVPRTVSSLDERSEQYRITRTGAGGFGSRPYMSPEQWNDARAVGPTSDVYSLGIVAYQLLTGRLPYTATPTESYYRLHCTAPVPSLGSGFSSELDQVICRALAKSPDERYRSALEMAAALREAMEARPQEKLRSLAKVWNGSERSPNLLLSGGELLQTSTEAIGDLERAYVAASQRRATRRVFMWRAIAASAVALVLGLVWYRGVVKTRAAVAEASITQAELEQGRSALLHGEPEAQRHLTEAYRRDPSPSTAFMLARALQPRLAEQARLASSFGRMRSATFSPSGTQIVTTDDRNAQIWDAQTYRLLFMLAHGDVVYDATYSTDGTKLVTSCGDGTVRIWDAASGTLLRELRRDGAKPRYLAVALSPDAKLVAAMDSDGTVAHVWDVGTGVLLAELSNEARMFLSVAFSPDGHWLATSGGNDVRVFDTKTWARVLSLPGPAIYALRWDPTGPRLLTGSAKGDASIWAIPSGERIHHLREIGEPIHAVAFSPDGRLAAAGSHDGAEQIWDAVTGTLRSQGNYLRDKILSTEFDRTSKFLVAASSSGSVAVADVAQGMPVAVLTGPRNVVIVAHFDPRSQRVVGASWDGTARVWDATSPYRKWSSPPIGDDCNTVTSLEPDQRFLAVACKDHPVQVWDTAYDQFLAELPSVTPAGGDFSSAYPAVASTGDRAAIARGNTVEVYELPGARLLRTIVHSASARVTTVAFANTGRAIVSGATDGSLLVTRDNGALLTLPPSSASIDAAGFLRDGSVIAADMQRHLRIYDATGVALAALEVSARVRMFRMSLDDHHLITVPTFTGKVASAELWDLEHYQLIGRLEAPGQGQVYSARFVAGNQIITTCADGSARLWDGTKGQLRQTYRGGPRFLVDVTTSPDGSMVIGGGGDGGLRFWAKDSGLPLWTIPAHKSHLIGIRVDGNEIVTRGFSGDISRWSLPSPAAVMEACRVHGRCAIAAP